MLILTSADVAEIFDMRTAFASVQEAALSYVQGRTESPPRAALQLADVPAEILVMPGTVDSSAFGLKVWYAMDRSVGSIPQSSALITLLDPELGHEVVLDGGIITDLRTGAMSGLAATRLAPAGSATVAIVGAGIQARSQALALVHAIDGIGTVRVYSRNQSRLEAFGESLQLELARAFPGRAIAVVPAQSAESACVGADIVVAATTSAVPVIRDEWLGQNVLVIGVGSHAPGDSELEPQTVGRARRVAVDTVRGAVDGAGDIAGAIAAGTLGRDDVVELGDLLAEEADDSDSGGLTVFKSVGFGAADIVSARLVARRAVARGLGTVIDLHS